MRAGSRSQEGVLLDVLVTLLPLVMGVMLLAGEDTSSADVDRE